MTSFEEELANAGDLDRFVSARLFDATPFVFKGERHDYLAWKANLAEGLEVDPYSILLIGSGAIGVSMGEAKWFRPFTEDSDIDVAVVSPYHFDEAWHFMRNIDSGRYDFDEKAQRQILRNAREYVFLGVIPTDRILKHLPFGPAWGKALDAAGDDPAIGGRIVKTRLYKDFGALRGYHRKGFETAQRRLLTEREEG